ncbi:MAG: hypothetical protein WCI92_04610, partial [Bacteroidota bacterium]
MQTHSLSFSTPYLYCAKKLSWLRYCILFLVLGLFTANRGFSEGSKQLIPTGSGTLSLTVYGAESLTGNGWRINFAAPGCPEKYRLHVHIKDYLTEKIYFGFQKGGGGVSCNYYQLRTPGGVAVYTNYQPVPTVATDSGYIQNWNAVNIGPKPLTGNGYLPRIYTPHENGDFYFEFSETVSGTWGAGNTGNITLFDITVVNESTTPKEIINGRVWSRAWQFSDGTYSPEASFYMYSNDSIVSKLKLPPNSWSGGTWSFYCNKFGSQDNGNWFTDRKSIRDAPAAILPGAAAQYKVFVNDADSFVYPTGHFGQICDASSESFCDGTVNILVKANKPGSIKLLIDIYPIGSNPFNEDVTLIKDILAVSGSCPTAAWETIPWNGLDNNGNPVVDGATVNMKFDYLNGLTNLPVYDIEGNTQGIMVDVVRPLPVTGGTRLPIYWNDSLLQYNSATTIRYNYDGCKYSGTSVNGPPYNNITGCHNWPSPTGGGSNSNGDHDIINSWWYYLSAFDVNLNLVIKHTPITPTTGPTGINPVCVGSTTVFTSPAILHAFQYVWTLPDGSTRVTATDTIHLYFPTIASGGQLKVHGRNVLCGDGEDSPFITITVDAVPLPSIDGLISTCNLTTIPYSCPVTTFPNYSWSLPLGGGTISPGTGLDNITVSWTGSGPREVLLSTTSVACGIRTATKNVIVDPWPETPAQAPTGPPTGKICKGGTTTFSIPLAQLPSAVSFDWDIPAGASIILGSGTNSIDVLFNAAMTAGIYTIKVRGINNCGTGAWSPTFAIEVVAFPTADAGPAQTICANSVVNLSGATATNPGSIVWTSSSGHPGFNNPNIEKPVYTPSNADTAAHTVTLTMTANGNTPCTPAISTVIITINPEPHAFAGPGAIVCQPDPYELAFSTVAGAPSFTWSSTTLPSGFSSLTTLHPIYTPNATDIANGSVTLTLTANPFTSCAVVSHDMVLLITKKPLADAGPAQTICANSTVTLVSATASEYSNIQWTSSSGY